MTKHEKVVQSIKDAMENVQHDYPDGKAKAHAYERLQEALLWVESGKIF